MKSFILAPAALLVGAALSAPVAPRAPTTDGPYIGHAIPDGNPWHGRSLPNTADVACSSDVNPEGNPWHGKRADSARRACPDGHGWIDRAVVARTDGEPTAIGRDVVTPVEVEKRALPLQRRPWETSGLPGVTGENPDDVGTGTSKDGQAQVFTRGRRAAAPAEDCAPPCYQREPASSPDGGFDSRTRSTRDYETGTDVTATNAEQKRASSEDCANGCYQKGTESTEEKDTAA